MLGALPRNSGTLASRFLAWTKDDAANYTTQLGARTDEFRNHVSAAGEIGCGLEMSLESWYRFLVDPNPPEDVYAEGDATNKRKVARRPYGGDPKQNPILVQRTAFLRSDSLVAVVMLTDENDCSLRDTNSYSWVPAQAGGSFRSYKPSSICATDPNNKCCFSCLAQLTNELPAGCSPDPVCNEGGGKLSAVDDPTGMRCFHMKQRFGFDFLFPVTRYSNALSLKQICPDQTYGDLDCDCTEAKRLGVACEPGTPVQNPLYQNLSGAAATGPDRDDSSAVFFAGIVGVPWQDLATDDAVASDAAPLQFKLAAELNWDSFAPTDVYAPNPALDPLMIESIAPRAGLAGPDSALLANPINGHEWNTNGNDLQYACIFSLEELGTRNCVQSSYCPDSTDLKCKRAFVGCSCSKYAEGYTENSPLCQTETGTYSAEQRYAKAYPGIRELQALRSFHELNNKTNNAIVASICPKTLAKSAQGTSGYGYNPAVAALVDRLKEKLGGTCLPRPLTADEKGNVPCAIVEAIPNDAANQEWCNCEAKQRKPVESELKDAVEGWP
ncbi:MAG: hypothetical protein QM784_01805 [Polyangiaceae bacterium]